MWCRLFLYVIMPSVRIRIPRFYRKEIKDDMGEYDKTCIRVFLENQLQLFPEKVAETQEEAEDFLDLCMASVCKNIREVRDCLDGYGADITGMSDADIENADEVFPLPDGRYLVVPA